MAHLRGTFEVTSWSEEPAEGLDGTAKVTVARIGQRFSGGIEAETVADNLMTYREDGTADFVGFQRVQGRVGERQGSFVLRSIGAYDGTEARSQLEIVAGSGRGDLVGLSGRGESSAGHGSTGVFHLDLGE